MPGSRWTNSTGRLGSVRDCDIDDARNSREALLYERGHAAQYQFRTERVTVVSPARAGEASAPSARVIETERFGHDFSRCAPCEGDFRALIRASFDQDSAHCLEQPIPRRMAGMGQAERTIHGRSADSSNLCGERCNISPHQAGRALPRTSSAP
jgi:hypothetical protein